MTALLLVLTPIALLDSVSVTPLASVPLLAMLGSRRPLSSSTSFISGIFIPYFLIGLLALVGLAGAIELLNDRLDAFLHRPDTLDITLQLAIGAAMLAFGWRLGRSRQQGGDRDAGAEIDWKGSFALGFTITLVGIPGALPYFAAIDQLLRADLPATPTLLALLYYNVICSLPLVAMVVIRSTLGTRSDAIFDWLAKVMGEASQRLIVVGLVALGGVLTADALLWLLGMPLIDYY
jgi:cytochrome c biogenesis protein CcdA